MWKKKKYSQCHVIFADIRKIDLSFKKKLLLVSTQQNLV